jgi:UTP-glucose-1-phosphate uridylyltransferase
MKKVIATIIFASMGNMLFAQNDVITKLFDQYYDNPNFTKVSVSSKMFDLFTEIDPEDEDEKQILDAISKLKGLKILAADSVADGKQLFNDAVKKISAQNYEELLTVKDAREDVQFMIKEKDGIIDELVLVVGGKKKFVVLSLFGEIELKNISKLSKSMKITGMEYLEKIDEKDDE